MKQTIVIIVLLSLVDLGLLYFYNEASDTLRDRNIEIENLRNTEDDLFLRYSESLNLEIELRNFLKNENLDSIMVYDKIDSDCLLVVLSHKTCWTCVEPELRKVLTFNKEVIFICPETFKNGIMMLSDRKYKILTPKSYPLLDKCGLFQSVYVKLENRLISFVYIPWFGVDWNFMNKLVELK